MARYKIEIDKCISKGLANDKHRWEVVDSTVLHVNAPNMYEADYKLNKLLPADDGFQYLIHISTDNKKSEPKPKVEAKKAPAKKAPAKKAAAKKAPAVKKAVAKKAPAKKKTTAKKKGK